MMDQTSRKTLYLFLVLIGIVALTVFILWKGFTEPETETETAQVEQVATEVNLDFSLLESEKVKYLKLPQELPEFEDEIQRDNPFDAYNVEETEEAEETEETEEAQEPEEE